MTSKLILLLSVFGVIPSALIPKSPAHNDLCPRSSRKSHRYGLITFIDDRNWNELLSGEWLLLLCSTRHATCEDLKADLYQLANPSVGCLDVGLAFGDLSEYFWLRGRFSAFGKITVYHVLDGEFRRLSSTQDAYSLRNLVILREWSELPRLPFWLHPTSTWSSFGEFVLKTMLKIRKSDIFGSTFWITAPLLSLFFIVVMPCMFLPSINQK
ncbi:uncharacterized protein Dere_GG15540 [Drosophila erecta]|uniref:Thioredoxin-related transmembrane protein 1 n=1 Tax=Drosophila erecta TaxID=7220 RepID=B3NH29_DROER|nr:uncharacterized protein Dere_GG15540 [Drosophila erecta]